MFNSGPWHGSNNHETKGRGGSMPRLPVVTLKRTAITAIAGLSLLGSASPVLAASPQDVGLTGPMDLVDGMEVRPEIGGTYYQTGRVTGERLTVAITFQLPAVPTAGRPGPVVVLWQGAVTGADRTHGDTVDRAVGDPHASAILPNCDAEGNCAIRAEMEITTRPAYEAADSPSLEHVGTGFLVAAVRTFGGTGDVQVAQPGVAGNFVQGSLAEPVDAYGALHLTPLLALDSVSPIRLRGDELGQGGDEMYDWAAAVRRAIAEFDPPPQPEPVPIAVWTPDKDDVRRLIVDLAFSVRCPEGRFVVIRNDTSGEVVLSLSVGGTTHASADVALPLSGLWTIGLHDSSGAALNAIQLSPSSNDVVITGPLRCTNGKGVINEEGVPFEIPNPSGYTAPTSTATPLPSQSDAPASVSAGGTTRDSGGVPVAGLGIATLALAVIGTLGVIVIRRVQPRRGTAR